MYHSIWQDDFRTHNMKGFQGSFNICSHLRHDPQDYSAALYWLLNYCIKNSMVDDLPSFPSTLFLSYFIPNQSDCKWECGHGPLLWKCNNAVWNIFMLGLSRKQYTPSFTPKYFSSYKFRWNFPCCISTNRRFCIRRPKIEYLILSSLSEHEPCLYNIQLNL